MFTTVFRPIIAGFAAATLLAGAAHASGQDQPASASQDKNAARTESKPQKKWLPANFRSSGQGQDAGRATPQQGEGLVIKTKSNPPRAENPAAGSGDERQDGTDPDGG